TTRLAAPCRNDNGVVALVPDPTGTRTRSDAARALLTATPREHRDAAGRVLAPDSLRDCDRARAARLRQSGGRIERRQSGSDAPRRRAGPEHLRPGRVREVRG